MVEEVLEPTSAQYCVHSSMHTSYTISPPTEGQDMDRPREEEEPLMKQQISNTSEVEIAMTDRRDRKTCLSTIASHGKEEKKMFD